MQKLGEVYLKQSNKRHYFSWVEGASYERIEVFDDLQAYNPINTSNCVAAYYRHTKEMFYGDAEIIKAIKRTKKEVLMAKGKTGREIKLIKDIPHFIQFKENLETGYMQRITLAAGKTVAEYFETPEIRIDITSVLSDRGMDVKPINIGDYDVYNVMKGERVDSGEAEYYSLEYLKATYDLDHIEDNDFVVVDNLLAADARLKMFAEAPTKIKAVDIETTGTEWTIFGKDVITGIVLSWDTNESTYYPFRQEKFKYNLPRSFMGKILEVLRDQPDDVIILAHNGKAEKQGFMKERPCYLKYSDYAVAWEESHNDSIKTGEKFEFSELPLYNVRIDRDTYILSVLVNPKQKKGLHTLKGLVSRITGQFYLELEQVFKNKDNIKFNVLPPEIVKYYACPDTANTIKVYKYLIDKLPKDEMRVFEFESELVRVKACNEFYGMRRNQEALIRKIENEQYKVKILGDMFREMHHTTKNINSADVRRDIFYNQLRCPVEVWTDKNLPSTSNIALTRILEIGALRDYDESQAPPDIKDLEGNTIIPGVELIKNKYPSLVILAAYAKCTKELGAYKRILNKSQRDRVMFYINQVGAGSGRQTSDAHQYSTGMKSLIQADSAHHHLWSSDWKQVELRVLAYVARQLDLIEMEKDPCVDVHRAILSLITGKPMWAITDKERKKGKTVNFGVVYMMSEYGLVKRLHGPAYTEEELVDALKAITDFYNSLPNVKAYVEGNKVFVRQNGYIATEMGRRRLFPEILDPTLPKRRAKSIERAANNTPVQGLAADMMKIVEVNYQSYIEEKGWDKLVDCDGVMLPLVRMMLSIHDEVLISSHESIPHEEIIKMCHICQEINIEGAPPFFSAPAVIDTWDDGKDDAYEIDLLFRDEIIKAWDNGHKRLLHLKTYCDDFTPDEVRVLQNKSAFLRNNCLTEADYDAKGKLKPTRATIDKVRNLLTADERFRFKKHLISPDEQFSEDEIEDIVITRILDKSYNQYLEDLNRFRSRRLNEWMDSLIAEHKTLDEVVAHIDHPELTHTLIKVMLGKDAKNMEHLDAIREAASRYMKAHSIDTAMFAEVKSIQSQEEAAEAEAVAAEEFRQEVEAGLTTYAELSQYVHVDENGELITEDTTDYEEEADDVSKSRFNTEVEAKQLSSEEYQKVYVQYTLRDVLVDLSEFRTLDFAEPVHQEIAKLHNPKAAYNVVYVFRSKMIRAGLRVDYKDKAAIAAILAKHKEVFETKSDKTG